MQINRFSDLHVHFRQGNMLKLVAPMTARYCDYALAMPNTTPPIDSPTGLLKYKTELEAHLGSCKPLMTFKLLPTMKPGDIRTFAAVGAVAGKLYPEGVTTNSSDGFSATYFKGDHYIVRQLLEAMQHWDLVLCIHGEMPGTFCLDRESQFLHWVGFVHKHFPKLRIVLEHVTTADAVKFVRDTDSEYLAATITAHHLLLTLDDVIGGNLHPHNFCKPIAKRESDRIILRAAASGSYGDRFFLGSDSAPHTMDNKECANGCAGVFTAPILPELLAETFDKLNWLGHLEGFTSVYGNHFYRLPASGKKLTLKRQNWRPPSFFYSPSGSCESAWTLTPFRSGIDLTWKVMEETK